MSQSPPRPGKPHLCILAVVLVLLSMTILVILWQTGTFDRHEIRWTRYPYLQNARSDRMTICWETTDPTTAVLNLSDTDGRDIQTVHTAAAARRHEITLADLHPAIRYRYEIRSHRTVDASQYGEFNTAPSPEIPINFAVVGDSRSDPATCEALADLIINAKVSMVIHTGDLIADATMPSQWDWMVFSPYRRLMQSIVFWPAIGNHELGPKEANELFNRTGYFDAFTLPAPESYYSFTWGDAYFLILDSNPDFCDNEDQYAFAQRDLATADAKWKFAVWHHPVFNSGIRHPSDIRMRTRYCPLLARHNIDAIFTGHDHNYQRSRPIRHAEEPLQQHPYLHLVCAGGGARLYEGHQDTLWHEHVAAVHHFLQIQIDGDLLTARAIDVDGRTFDQFTVDKSGSQEHFITYEEIERVRLAEEEKALEQQDTPQ